MCQIDWHGHEGWRFIACVTEHHPLVAGTDLIQLFIGDLAALDLEGFIHAHRDISRLAGDGGHDRTGVSIETFFAAIVTDVLDHLADQVIKIDKGVGGDLA